MKATQGGGGGRKMSSKGSPLLNAALSFISTIIAGHDHTFLSGLILDGFLDMKLPKIHEYRLKLEFL